MKHKADKNEEKAEIIYLKDCLKSTPKQRLDWLEEAQIFVKSIRPARKIRKSSK